MLGAPASLASFDGWPYYVKEDQGTWAAYYRSHARVRLGPEQRMPNGVSWRLHIDVGTGLAMPRITWMPDARRTRTANGLLDMAHGGAMLVSRAAGRELDEINEWAPGAGFPVFHYDKPVIQTDVGLTYATPNLVSLVDLGYFDHEGSGTWRIIRGLTFDLAAGRMFGIDACPDSDIGYADRQYTVDKQGLREPINYLFQFGPLRVCNGEAYEKFVELLKRRAILVAEQAAGSKDPVVRPCSEKPNVEQHIDKDQEIVLYLTFKGLAVHNTEYWPNSSRSTCTLARNPVNPIILPYRELEPFMVPGPWRDELLKLK